MATTYHSRKRRKNDLPLYPRPLPSALVAAAETAATHPTKDDPETAVPKPEVPQYLGRVHQFAKVSSQQYGISGEGKLRWKLGIGVKRDFDAHIISLSQGPYINNILELFGL